MIGLLGGRDGDGGACGRQLAVDRASGGERRTLRDGGVSVNRLAICGTDGPHEFGCVLG
jgi:hypothetical protein